MSSSRSFLLRGYYKKLKREKEAKIERKLGRGRPNMTQKRSLENRAFCGQMLITVP